MDVDNLIAKGRRNQRNRGSCRFASRAARPHDDQSRAAERVQGTMHRVIGGTRQLRIKYP